MVAISYSAPRRAVKYTNIAFYLVYVTKAMNANQLVNVFFILASYACNCTIQIKTAYSSHQ